MIRRRHLKPRVRLTRTWRGEEEYVCAGNGCGGSGQTPLEAIHNWRRAMAREAQRVV
jgi:hypothetical protein